MLCPAMVFCTSEGVGQSGRHHGLYPTRTSLPALSPSPMAPFVFSSLRDPKAIVGRRQVK